MSILGPLMVGLSQHSRTFSKYIYYLWGVGLIHRNILRKADKLFPRNYDHSYWSIDFPWVPNWHSGHINVQVDISEVSSIFAFKSLGGLVGSLATGLLMDYCNPSTDYIFIAGSYFIKCLMTLLLPYSASLLGQIFSIYC